MIRFLNLRNGLLISQLVWPLAIMAFHVCVPFLQCQTTTAKEASVPSFEVVSIRKSNPTESQHGWQEDRSPERITITGATLKALADTAYDVKLDFVSGGASWVEESQWDVTATIDDLDREKLRVLSDEDRQRQMHLMLRAVLEDRFKLKVNIMPKEYPGYALVVASNGPKIQKSISHEPETGVAVSSPALKPAASMTAAGWTVRDEPMSFWADRLSSENEIGRKVVDHTGLTGNYQFTFRWRPSKDGTGVSIFTALQEQLGLRLEPTRVEVRSLIIVHAEKPTPN